jgi:site-specific DNA-methyltransferase (adenine-specific)
MPMDRTTELEPAALSKVRSAPGHDGVAIVKPYYEQDGITIYHGDNREVLPALDVEVDLVFTSPPYNIGLSPGGCGSGFYPRSRGGRDFSKWRGFSGYGVHNDAMPQAEYETWQQDVLRWCWAALSDCGAIFYNHKPRIVFKQAWLPLVLNPGLPLRQIIVWDGDRGFGLGDAHFCPAAEWIMLFARDQFALTSRQASALTDIWRIPSEKHSQHPAPFPVALPGRAIASTSSSGLVLDPHMGSGTTLIAAKSAGRRAIGIEIEERYCEIAAKRLSQGVLFGAEMPA